MNMQVAEAHEEPPCGKGTDAWQGRFVPWLAYASAGGSGVRDSAAAFSSAEVGFNVCLGKGRSSLHT